MTFGTLLKITRNLPVIDTEILLSGITLTTGIKVQISRWVGQHKLIQLKRGIYVLTEPYRKIEIFEPFIASILKKPSYISMEKALEYHNLIPEAVTIYTSVTTKRPGKIFSEIGIFDYRHIKTSLFWGYDSISVHNQVAFIAFPEKALLDLIYLRSGKISKDYLEELRLQNVDNINVKTLFDYAARFKKPSMLTAVNIIAEYIKYYKKGRKIL
jgi:predicted transcriptional regulator of viral defense system